MAFKKKLLIIQEILPEYRCQHFHSLSQASDCHITVFAEVANKDFGDFDLSNFGFKFVKANWCKFLSIFKYDYSAVRLWLKHDVIVHGADFKFISLWLLLFLSIFTPKKFFLYGQGGYKRKGLRAKLVYVSSIFFCDAYICYTEYSREALYKKLPKFLYKKIKVCDNTLIIDPVASVLSKNVNQSLFYVGRLREGCGIELLLNAATKAGVKVEIIGSGNIDYINCLKKEFGSVAVFYGAVYDLNEQKEIAKKCFAGVYAGDAGLSVVHYMSLGLPVIVHSEMEKHMGPEPTYIKNNYNGFLFKRGDVDSLVEKILKLSFDDELRYSVAKSSLQTFNQLAQPSMGEKLSKILDLP